MQKLLITIAVAWLLASCHVKTVDVAQPVAVADKFYGSLKFGDGKTALAQFAPEFKSQADNWPKLLGGLQQRYGPVTATELKSSSLAADGNDPCYSLAYEVKRGSLDSDEVLFLCSRDGTAPWLIRGHKLTRMDTQQTISAGVLPTEVGIHVP
jgi:hypothetical protein